MQASENASKHTPELPCNLKIWTRLVSGPGGGGNRNVMIREKRALPLVAAQYVARALSSTKAMATSKPSLRNHAVRLCG